LARPATTRTGSANATFFDQLPGETNHAGDRIAGVAGDHLAPGHRAQPRQLALRELARRRGRRGGDGVGVALVERRPRLPIADGAHRRQAGVQVAAGTQRAHLGDESRVEHRREALADACVQPGTIVRLEGDQRRRPAVGRAVPGRKRSAAQAMDFERALDALAVVRREASGGLRVDRRELGVQGRPAGACGALVDCRADRGIGLGQRVEAIEQRLEIEHRAADEQRDRAARADRRDRRVGVGDEARRRIALGRVDDVDQVVRHGSALGRARLRGADVHAAVDERRVDADDLDRPARRERGGDRQCGRALARRRRSGQAEVTSGAGAHRRRSSRGPRRR
jgi:hypothetical protein